MTADIYLLVFAYIHHVPQSFGTRTWSSTTILWKLLNHQCAPCQKNMPYLKAKQLWQASFIFSMWFLGSPPFVTVFIKTFIFCSHDSSFLPYQAQIFTEQCFFIHFPWIDVKSSRCFSGTSLISIILCEYCEDNIKTFPHKIISQKNLRLFLWVLFKTFPLIRLHLLS